MNVSWLNNHHVEHGKTGTNFRQENLTLIQAIPYTHNKFLNHYNPIWIVLYGHYI